MKGLQWVTHLMEKGIIFNIQRNQIHDGPGIRTIVFLKGCPLSCVWCCNPESQSVKPELFFYKSKCVLCGKCIESCPHNAGRIIGGSIIIDRTLCSTCDTIKKCVDACPNSARQIRGDEMSREDILKQVEKDRNYYFISGGGVTIGGGEPLFQPEFVLNLLKCCRKRGLNTAVETCGYCRWEDLEKVLEYTDWIFYDLKLINNQKHKEYTGVSNDIILENASKLSDAMGSSQCRLVVRIPIIPGYTDSKDNIVGIAGFVKKYMKAAKEIEILNYHSYGYGKYEALGRKYDLCAGKALSEEKILEIKDLIEARGIACKCELENNKFNTTGAI